MAYVHVASGKTGVSPAPIWDIPSPVPPAAMALHGNPLVAELLFRRGIGSPGDADDFLDARPRPAPDPYRLPSLDAAVERLGWAIDRGETIAIFGDYDVDGVTATAIMTRALSGAAAEAGRGGQVLSRLPLRAEGYGLNRAAIDDFVAAGARLLVAVDCASSDHEQVGYAIERGLDVIVIDHHQMQGPGPAGAIVVSPYAAADSPFREMAAVGVAYLVIVALAREGRRVDGNGGGPETGLLDHVALGTIGDISPLTGVNRALVRDGLRRMRAAPRLGLAALLKKAGIDPPGLTADRIAFKVTPRINAAGRMGDPHLALRLMLSASPLEAAMLADEIETLNAERRQVSAEIIADAEAKLLARPDLDRRRALVVTGDGWRAGVLGIAASQLAGRFGRPVLVLADDGESSTGSARSTPGFDIAAALASASGLLDRFGGHSQAAGLSARTRNVTALEDALDVLVGLAGIDVPVPPRLAFDATLELDRLQLETAHALESLEPYGADNERPLFYIPDVQVRQYEVIGQDRSHLRLVLGTPRGNVKAVAFGAAARSRELVTNRQIDVAGVVGIDRWNGRERLDVEVKDFRAAE